MFENDDFFHSFGFWINIFRFHLHLKLTQLPFGLHLYYHFKFKLSATFYEVNFSKNVQIDINFWHSVKWWEFEVEDTKQTFMFAFSVSLLPTCLLIGLEFHTQSQITFIEKIEWMSSPCFQGKKILNVLTVFRISYYYHLRKNHRTSRPEPLFVSRQCVNIQIRT